MADRRPDGQDGAGDEPANRWWKEAYWAARLVAGLAVALGLLWVFDAI